MSGESKFDCRLCGKAVVVERDRYEVFEQMHWLCFHIVYEHEGDVDEPCGDPTRLQWHIRVYRQRLEQLGHDPDEVIGEAIDERYGL